VEGEVVKNTEGERVGVEGVGRRGEEERVEWVERGGYEVVEWRMRREPEIGRPLSSQKTSRLGSLVPVSLIAILILGLGAHLSTYNLFTWLVHDFTEVFLSDEKTGGYSVGIRRPGGRG